LKMVIDNYSSLLKFFDEVAESDKTEAAAKDSGLIQQCLQFDNFFILRLLYKVFHGLKLSVVQVCLALTIPVTTCIAEQSFSTLHRLRERRERVGS